MDKNKNIHNKIMSEYNYKEVNKLIMMKIPKQPKIRNYDQKNHLI